MTAFYTCKLCHLPTTNSGTMNCDRCWELSRRVLADPKLAQKILDTTSTKVGYQEWHESIFRDPEMPRDDTLRELAEDDGWMDELFDTGSYTVELNGQNYVVVLSVSKEVV